MFIKLDKQGVGGCDGKIDTYNNTSVSGIRILSPETARGRQLMCK